MYSLEEHKIDINQIDLDALTVLRRLQDSGFIAYLVGGSVRDLLIKKKPKDYDISTSARPEQIKQLFFFFCFLIGRRFRLAHIRIGNKIFEVSTFRSGDVNESDLITRDNQWGTPQEDVLRRDFTINGLFYDPSTQTVIDYVGGYQDAEQGVLRTIGNPFLRFKQDPVRMLRLLKFHARFRFPIVKETEEALVACKDEIIKSSPARLLEEILKMLESGKSSPFFKLLAHFGLLDLLFPCLTHFLNGKFGEQIFLFLQAADQIIHKYHSQALERPILTSCLLFPILDREIHIQFLNKHQHPHVGDISQLSSSLIKAIVTSSFSHFPRRISSSMNFILSAQYRLTPLFGNINYRSNILHHPDCPLALKFLRVRAQINPDLLEVYNAWKKAFRPTRHFSEKNREKQKINPSAISSK